MRSAVSDVREQAGEVRSALLNPVEAGDFAAEILRLNAAIDRLRAFQAELDGKPPVGEERAALHRDLKALKTDLARLATLAGHGEAFWRGWGRLLGLEGGYTQAGLPASPTGAKATTKVVA